MFWKLWEPCLQKLSYLLARITYENVYIKDKEHSSNNVKTLKVHFFHHFHAKRFFCIFSKTAHRMISILFVPEKVCLGVINHGFGFFGTFCLTYVTVQDQCANPGSEAASKNNLHSFIVWNDWVPKVIHFTIYIH